MRLREGLLLNTDSFCAAADHAARGDPTAGGPYGHDKGGTQNQGETWSEVLLWGCCELAVGRVAADCAVCQERIKKLAGNGPLSGWSCSLYELFNYLPKRGR